MSANPMERLTPRECEVLALAAEGLANKEIARRLEPRVATETVKRHLHSIFLKLEVESRTAAVATYLKPPARE